MRLRDRPEDGGVGVRAPTSFPPRSVTLVLRRFNDVSFLNADRSFKPASVTFVEETSSVLEFAEARKVLHRRICYVSVPSDIWQFELVVLALPCRSGLA